MRRLDLVIKHEGNSVYRVTLEYMLELLLGYLEFVDHSSSLCRACLIMHPTHLMYLSATQRAQCAMSRLDLVIKHDGSVVYKVLL